MPDIGITVKDKVARPNVKDVWAVCGNTDYTVTWTLDDEWSSAHIRTAVFAWRDRHTNHSVPVIFEGDTCPMPLIPDALVCAVGLWASVQDGSDEHILRTTSPAMITMRRSATSDTDKPVITQDVYDELIAAVNGLLDAPVEAAGKYAAEAEKHAQTASDAAQTAAEAMTAAEEYAKDARGASSQAADAANAAEESYGRTAELVADAETAADRAEQAAAANGYAAFEIKNDGHLYNARTSNIAERVTFRISDEHLEVEISG